VIYHSALAFVFGSTFIDPNLFHHGNFLKLIPICSQKVAQASRLCKRRLKPAATKNSFLTATRYYPIIFHGGLWPSGHDGSPRMTITIAMPFFNPPAGAKITPKNPTS
jgi:hypothetical protein